MIQKERVCKIVHLFLDISPQEDVHEKTFTNGGVAQPVRAEES